MLPSTLVLAWKVLTRRKLFTAISLFGVALTLLVLVVASALVDHVFAPRSPERRFDRVLGVWCIASVAGTMIAQAAQAMEFGATSEDIAYTCHAHPTHSEALKEAAMAVTGKPIHI